MDPWRPGARCGPGRRGRAEEMEGQNGAREAEVAACRHHVGGLWPMARERNEGVAQSAEIGIHGAALRNA